MTPPLRFTIPGPPIAKGRPRVVKGHAYTPPATVSYERKVAMVARSAMVGIGSQPFRGEVSVSLHFYMPTARRVDVDNLAKCVMDSLNKIAWDDDSQVSMLFANRLIDRAQPRTVVIIEANPEPE